MAASSGQHCQDATQFRTKLERTILRLLEGHNRVVNAFSEVSSLLSREMYILRPLVCGDHVATGRTSSPQPLLAPLSWSEGGLQI